ncbi:MAG: tetratricopeptide repeat protein [Chthoniobacterales bacterium]|nr:tetratricopeptide repeat protein [Chthoniobacterales bacterium]
MKIFAAIALLLVAAHASAQMEPEVRRAEAVVPAPPAVPFAAPAVPAQAVAAPEAVPSGEIRTLPSGALADPLMARFEEGNGFYAQKMYDLAVPKYQEFLQMRRAGAEREAALFRMGESLRLVRRGAEAMTAFQSLLGQYNTGEFVGPAAYRLGEMQYAAKDYAAAADSFRAAAQHVRDAKLRLAAKFFEARSLDGSDRKLEALSAYREVVAQQGENPYRERAMFELADADARAGLTDGAFRQFRKLAETAKNPAVRTGAAVKAGLLAIDARDYAAVRPLLEPAAANRELASWRAAAGIGLLRLDYEEGNYAAVTDRADKLLNEAGGGSRADILLMAANAQRQLGEPGKALALYDKLVASYPDSTAAKEAGFHRLVSLVAQRDEKAEAQIDQFISGAGGSSERARASLLKAELLFERKDYAGAGKLYAAGSRDADTGKYRADALYKLAWCRMQEKQYDSATSALTEFLGQYPRAPQVPAAYLQRALAQMQTGQFDGALGDFSAIIEKNKDAPEREGAMLQQALLLGKLSRTSEMAKAFQRLLAEYPQTKAAAQANFWTGYAAFEAKKYGEAIPALQAARQLDKDNYGERASVRLLLAHYYLQDQASTAAEARSLGAEKSPAEVREWLGMSALDAGDFAGAREFLEPLGSAEDADDELRLSLARAQAGAKDHTGARITLQKLLPRLIQPKDKARAHLMLAETFIGSGDGTGAKAQAEEALRLQPEGRINAEARLVNGRALLAQARYDDAARAFMAIALLYDEKDLTPQALVLAEQAYRQAQNVPDAERAREELQRRYPEYQRPEQS